MNAQRFFGFALVLSLVGCGSSNSTSSNQSGANTPGAGGLSGITPAASGGATGTAPSGAGGATGLGTGGAHVLGSGGIPPLGQGGVAPLGLGGTVPLGMGGVAPLGQGGTVPLGTGGMSPFGTGGSTTIPAGGAGGMVQSLPPGGTDPTKLPTASGDCPQIATGTVMVSGVPVVLWVGNKSATQKGPVFIYWHGTGGDGSLAAFDLDPTLRSEILGLGGVIAAPNGSTGMGGPVDWGVWTLGDLAIADQIVACSIQQLNIDTHRIYTGGSSAGGLMAGAMTYQRSGYIAASNPNSGGLAPWPGLGILQDPAHVPAVMTMHGKMGVDMVVIDFAQVSIAMDHDIVAKGGFAVDCDHGGGHTLAPADLKAAGWTFLKAHPYGTKPSPYAGGLPSGFPSYCTIMKAQ